MRSASALDPAPPQASPLASGLSLCGPLGVAVGFVCVLPAVGSPALYTDCWVGGWVGGWVFSSPSCDIDSYDLCDQDAETRMQPRIHACILYSCSLHACTKHVCMRASGIPRRFRSGCDPRHQAAPSGLRRRYLHRPVSEVPALCRGVGGWSLWTLQGTLRTWTRRLKASTGRHKSCARLAGRCQSSPFAHDGKASRPENMCKNCKPCGSPSCFVSLQGLRTCIVDIRFDSRC